MTGGDEDIVARRLRIYKESVVAHVRSAAHLPSLCLANPTAVAERVMEMVNQRVVQCRLASIEPSIDDVHRFTADALEQLERAEDERRRERYAH